MVKIFKIVTNDACYYPGSVVKGVVLVSVDKPKYYKEVSITIFGFASTQWTDHTRDTAITYTNMVTFIRKNYTLWSSEGDPTGYLPVGDHNFPFNIQLPDIAPPSFRGIFGKIIYQLKATIAQKKLLKFSHNVKAVLQVKSPGIPIGMEEPKTTELNSNVRFCCCFNFGPVNITCSLPRTGFFVGETIPLNMHVQNLSINNIYIHASISRTEFYHSERGSTRATIRNNLSALSLPNVPVGTSASLEGHSLSIPSTLPASISSCTIIKVSYFLVFKAKSSLGSSKRMTIPIFITHALPQS